METVNFFEVNEWDNLIQTTYKKPYSFQQQGGCKDRGIARFIVPTIPEDFENTSVPEIVNHSDMGVSFVAWLDRDPTKPLDGGGDPGEATTNPRYITMWWERNFYPALEILAQDLYSRGLLKAGNYIINIDW